MINKYSKIDPNLRLRLKIDIEKKTKRLWDPISRIDNEEVIQDNTSFLNLYNNLKTFKHVKFYNFIYDFFVTILLLFFLTLLLFLDITYLGFITFYFGESNRLLIVVALYIMILVIPFFVNRSLQKHSSRGLVEIFLCQQLNWIAYPSPDTKRYNLLRRFYPYTFNKNESSGYIKNQIWGFKNYNSKNYFFTLGVLELLFLNSRAPYENYYSYVIFKLDKTVPFRFAIVPNVKSKLDNKKYLDFFESNFIYKYEQENSSFDFISDKLKTEIVKLYLTLNFNLIEFRDNTMLISFEDNLYDIEHTNIIKSSNISEIDINRINNSIYQLVSLVSKTIDIYNENS